MEEDEWRYGAIGDGCWSVVEWFRCRGLEERMEPAEGLFTHSSIGVREAVHVALVLLAELGDFSHGACVYVLLLHRVKEQMAGEWWEKIKKPVRLFALVQGGDGYGYGKVSALEALEQREDLFSFRPVRIS